MQNFNYLIDKGFALTPMIQTGGKGIKYIKDWKKKSADEGKYAVLDSMQNGNELYAVRTGKISDILILRLDMKTAEDLGTDISALKKLCDSAKTYTVCNPNKGLDYYFIYADIGKRTKMLKSVEVLGDDDA
eukprot:758126-Hanusia_phi.AAC.1